MLEETTLHCNVRNDTHPMWKDNPRGTAGNEDTPRMWRSNMACLVHTTAMVTHRGSWLERHDEKWEDQLCDCVHAILHCTTCPMATNETKLGWGGGGASVGERCVLCWHGRNTNTTREARAVVNRTHPVHGCGLLACDAEDVCQQNIPKTSGAFTCTKLEGQTDW